jgi:hypothetical protein
LNANVVNVGEPGVALPILAGYLALTVMVFVLLCVQRALYLRTHFFLFLILIAWISLRIVVDLDDVSELKDLIIGTTGGVLVFYLLGALLGITYQSVIMEVDKGGLIKLILLLFLGLVLWMGFNFLQRLHPRLFFLTGINGSYQREGNFLSISYIIVSFLYLLYSLKGIGRNLSRLNVFFWLSVYSISTLVALVGSQLFGSNSATAVMLGVYLITLVMSFLVFRRGIFSAYCRNKLYLPWSKKFLTRLILIITLTSLGVIIVAIFVISMLDVDIYSTRLFGFGTGSNSSISSRIEILTEVGLTQIGYAPVFGDLNVAFLTTGDSGKTLHSFFPFILANLGLVGLLITLILFAAVFLQLYREIKYKPNSNFFFYERNMLAIYSSCILVYLIFFANLAVGAFWPVLWFMLGFISKPFGFKCYE